MIERRVLKLETTISDHDRRITDADSKIEMVIAWKNAIEESTEVNRELVEVGKALLKLLGWIKLASKWITSVGLACGIIWGAIKVIITLGRWHP